MTAISSDYGKRLEEMAVRNRELTDRYARLLDAIDRSIQRCVTCTNSKYPCPLCTVLRHAIVASVPVGTNDEPMTDEFIARRQRVFAEAAGCISGPPDASDNHGDHGHTQSEAVPVRVSVLLSWTKGGGNLWFVCVKVGFSGFSIGDGWEKKDRAERDAQHFAAALRRAGCTVVEDAP